MTTKRSLTRLPAHLLRCVLVLAVLAYGSVGQADEYPNEDPVKLDTSTVEELNNAVGGRSVNFVLNFVEENGAIVPAEAGKKLVPTTEAPNFEETPPRVILFFDNNDEICVQKPSGEWKCYESS